MVSFQTVPEIIQYLSIFLECRWIHKNLTQLYTSYASMNEIIIKIILLMITLNQKV